MHQSSSLRTPPTYKKGAAFAMVARAAPRPVGCTNGSTWHQVAEFLDAQHLRLINLAQAADSQSEAAAAAGLRVAVPHGNHGDNNFPPSGAVLGGLTS